MVKMIVLKRRPVEKSCENNRIISEEFVPRSVLNQTTKFPLN